MTAEPFTLRVRHGLEFTDDRPIGVVYLVDRRDPLVELIHALPVGEAWRLAVGIRLAMAQEHDPVSVVVRDRDGHDIELTLPLAAAQHACHTIRRHADAASILRRRRPSEMAA